MFTFNRKIRKTEFIYICGSKNGSSSSTVNTGEIWGDVSRVQTVINRARQRNRAVSGGCAISSMVKVNIMVNILYRELNYNLTLAVLAGAASAVKSHHPWKAHEIILSLSDFIWI